MTEQILIRFSGDQFEWLVVDGKGRSGSGVGHGGGEELADRCSGRQVTLLVPGEEVLLTHVTLPTRNAAGIARALPYAVEEQLAEDIEQLHFARGAQDPEGEIPVAVIRRQSLDHCLERLAQLGIRPVSACATPLLLPWQEGSWTLLIEDRKALLRYGREQGAELALASLPPLIRRLLREHTTRPRLRIWYSGDTPPDTTALEATGCELDSSPVPESGMAMMAATLVADPPLNLLQGAYGQQGTASLKRLGPWRAAIALLVLAGLVQLGGAGYDHWQLRQEERTLTREIEALYRDAFPDAGKIRRGSLRQQADQKLLELRRQYGRGSDTFLALLHTSGEVLQKEKELRLEGLNYKGGTLNLRLQGSDLSQFEAFKQKLLQGREREIKVEVLSAISRREGVDGRIMIQERKSS